MSDDVVRLDTQDLQVATGHSNEAVNSKHNDDSATTQGYVSAACIQ
jgi:hypothetical protein